jgi:hypothetical protein
MLSRPHPSRKMIRVSVRIPTEWVELGRAIPTVCTRHGRPEVRRIPTDISQSAPWWIHLLAVFGHIVALFARLAWESSTVAARWPFCDQCVKRRYATIAGIAASVVTGLGAVVFVAMLDLAGPFIAIVLILLLAPLLALHLFTWSWLSGAHMTAHTGWNEVPKAHPEFAAQFERLRIETLRQETLHRIDSTVPHPSPRAETVRGPIVKRLNPAWYVVLVVGILLVITGAFKLFAGATCGPQIMGPGDECETTSNRGQVTVTTYEHERSVANGFAVAGIAGAVIALGAGIRIRRWNRAYRRAWAAHQQGQPTHQSAV